MSRITSVCTENCPFRSTEPHQYLKHLAECETVAPWVKAWAQRVAARGDWRKVVGLTH